MIITSSSLVSASTHSLTRTHTITESLSVSLPALLPEAENTASDTRPRVEFRVSAPQASTINQGAPVTELASIDIRLMFIKALLEKLTGIPIELIRFEEAPAYHGPTSNPGATEPVSTDAGFSVSFSRNETYQESEQTR